MRTSVRRKITGDGVFRQASFKGMRSDKNAKDVVPETEKPTDETVTGVENLKVSPKKGKIAKTIKNNKRQPLLQPAGEKQVKKICGHDLTFNNLGKVYWPEDNITKRDMFNFYHQVAPFILPYLRDRPMSLNRFPGGIHGESFYQKDVTDKAPSWARTFAHETSGGKQNNYLVGGDEDTLLWMASLGCIEMNPWFSRVQSPDSPDYCVIDLDPRPADL